MTIAHLATGERFEVQLEADEFNMLWLEKRHRVRGTRQVRLLLSAALKRGWRIVESTPAERTLLKQQGFGSGRLQ